MKTLRIVSYAINGRGMGHLTRQLAILRWVRRILALLDIKSEIWVLTSSEADTLARREGFAALKMPSKAMMRDAGIEPNRYLGICRTWVMNAIAGLGPDLLLVDTFPGGSFGELVAALELARHRVLVARRVRQGFAEEEAYKALLPIYEQIIRPDTDGVGPILLREPDEMMEPAAARTALGVEAGRRAVYLSLGGGGDVAAPEMLPRLVRELRARDWHVVVGAGPLYIGEEIRGPGVTWLDRYVPMELLPGVDAAVAAAGYNTFHELMSAGIPTVFVPQPRIADDQEARAQRAVVAGAGRVAARLEDIPDLLEAPGDAAAARALVPTGGARAAALQALSTIVPHEDLAMADRVLAPDLLRMLEKLDRGSPVQQTRRALELVRLLAGGTPSEAAQRRALLLELQDQGHFDGPGQKAPELPGPVGDPSERVRRFLALCTDHAIPLDTAITLTRNLARKFPAARGQALLEGLELLIPTWARFDDWMGAISLLRAVPTQRGLPLEAFARQMATWLKKQEDLFDAVRDLSRTEGGGKRTIAEALRILTTEAASP